MAQPVGLKLVPPKFEVVTEKELDQFVKDNTKRNGVLVFIAIDVVDYENLSLNTAEYERYIQQQKALIDHYENSLRDE